MRQSKKLFYYILFFLIISSIYVFDTYHKLNKEMGLLHEQKKAIETIDVYHQLDVLLKERRGLSQIDSLKASNQVELLDYKIISILGKFKNRKIVQKVKNLLERNYVNKKNLFYEYTKVINVLNIEKIGFYNTSKFIFQEKHTNYLLNAIFIYELPSMIENLGKMRGIGSGILNIKRIAANERYILEDNLNNFKYTFYKFSKSISLNQVEILNQITHLENLLNLLKQENFKISAYDYFVNVSKMIDSLNIHYSYGKRIISKIINTEIKNIQTSLAIYFVIYLIFAVIMILSITRSYKISRFQKLKYTFEKRERSILHMLHQKLYACHDLKSLCDEMLQILSKPFEIESATLYILDERNFQMNLVSTYGISSNQVEHIIALNNNYNYEVLMYRKNMIKSNALYIPIIYEEKKLASFCFVFNSSFKKTVFSKKIIQLCADYIYKVQKNEENKKYFNLIDNYVLTSSTNKEGLITYVSEALCKNTKYHKEELLGRSHSLLKDPSFDKKIYTTLWEEIIKGNTFRGEIRNLKKDGSPYWLDVIISPEFGFYGDIIGYNSIRYDITDKKRVESLAIKDALTNIYNRRFFDEIFPRKIKDVQREQGFLVFALLDIDFFKQYNDTYGHSQGDITLKTVATTLQKQFKRTGDYVFRLGGEEFGLLFKCKNKSDGQQMLQSILSHKMLKTIEHKSSLVSSFLTLSIGAYFIDEKNQLNEKQIYDLADNFLYEVKKSSRNDFKSN